MLALIPFYFCFSFHVLVQNYVLLNLYFLKLTDSEDMGISDVQWLSFCTIRDLLCVFAYCRLPMLQCMNCFASPNYAPPVSKESCVTGIIGCHS